MALVPRKVKLLVFGGAAHWPRRPIYEPPAIFEGGTLVVHCLKVRIKIHETSAHCLDDSVGKFNTFVFMLKVIFYWHVN